MTDFRTVCVSDPRFEHDGLRHVTVKSPALRGRGDVTVWCPPGVDEPAGLVILLHGVYGSHWAWALQGGAHRTAARLIADDAIPAFALAMPSDGLRGDGSGYVRHADGFDAARWIVHEVPLATREAIPGLRHDVPRFIAGLSMGGFGALRLGAASPNAFRAVSGHSSITHISQMVQFIEEDVASIGAPPEDASVLDAIIRAGDRLPPLRFDCGVDDQLIEENRALHRDLEARGIAHTYEEFPGAHTWAYWERHLEDTLRFFAAHD
ncbi:alpha/beta hydrolase [Luteitalea sp.]|jgi:putative tributyrin esterase|uniref:alpha/beta hydrolase n=1 Tax=Luteitalea sp. TaxID=2004800 RepID=UPI0037C62696